MTANIATTDDGFWYLCNETPDGGVSYEFVRWNEVLQRGDARSEEELMHLFESFMLRERKLIN